MCEVILWLVPCFGLVLVLLLLFIDSIWDKFPSWSETPRLKWPSDPIAQVAGPGICRHAGFACRFRILSCNPQASGHKEPEPTGSSSLCPEYLEAFWFPSWQLGSSGEPLVTILLLFLKNKCLLKILSFNTFFTMLYFLEIVFHTYTRAARAPD